jgi:HptB-dependent secretion and biofilm anti anti-sigma factor
MKYEIIEGGRGATLVLRDQLTFSDRDGFDTVIDRLLGKGSSRVVVVDLAQLDYMDSAGLGMLLTLRDRAEKTGVEARLAKPKGDVRELLALACFDTLFSIDA